MKESLSLKSRPLVSVVIPTYNRFHYLEQSLRSAVQQTYQNIEIIVSDNHSPQNPADLVQSLKDPRIRFYRHPKNLGMFENVKRAFLQAKGKYVSSLLDDDMWEPNFLEKLLPPLEADPSLVLSFCDHYVINEKGEIDYAATDACSKQNNRSDLPEGTYRPFYDLGLVTGAVSTSMAALIRREYLDWNQVPSEAGSLWDAYISYLCCTTGLGAYYYPGKLTRVREHSQTETQQSGRSSSQAKIRKGKAQIFCYEKFLVDERLQGFHSCFQQRWAHANTTLGIGLMRNEQVSEARPYLWRSLQAQFDWRTLSAFLLSYTPTSIASRF